VLHPLIGASSGRLAAVRRLYTGLIQQVNLNGFQG
jgi:hypothetical protein